MTSMTIESFVPDGVYTPIVTFFTHDYQLDLKAQIDHAKYLYQSGIKGLVIAGSMGEACHMSREERHDLVKALKTAIPDPNFKLIAGAPQLSINDAIKEGESAKDAGADFMIFHVPGFFGPHLTQQQGIVDYFCLIADSCPLPIIIYNYPGVSNNVVVSADSFRKLSKHPNIVGVKLTHFNLDLYTLIGKDKDISNNNFKAFTGLGQVLVPAMSVGIRGTIDGLSGVFPKVMIKLFDLVEQGKLQEASDLQYIVAKADAMIGDLNSMGTKIAIKKYLGIGSFMAGRPPMNQLADEGYKKYDEDLGVVYEVEKAL